MNTIDEFLQIDQDNIVETKRVLSKIHEKSLDAVEDCAKLFQEISDTFGQKYLYDKYEKVFRGWVGEFDLPFAEAIINC